MNLKKLEKKWTSETLPHLEDLKARLLIVEYQSYVYQYESKIKIGPRKNFIIVYRKLCIPKYKTRMKRSKL